MNKVALLFAVATIAATSFSGCTTLSGAASMQVEVDAYTGPLSQGHRSQTAQILAVLDGAWLSFRLFMKDIAGEFPSAGDDLYAFCKTAATASGGKTPAVKADSEDLCFDVARVSIRLRVARELLTRSLPGATTGTTEGRGSPLPPSQRVSAADLAALDDLVRQLESDGGPNRQTTGDLQGGNLGAVPSNGVPENLQEVAWLTILQLHGFMQDRADTWTKRGIAYRVDPGNDVRREWAQFASLAGHYGQLIGSRIDVLLKQLDVACNTGDRWSAVIDCLFAANASSGNWWNPAARRLATLEYLRDSTADGHMEQFRWLELEPAGGSELSVDESVRAARMLFENNYWTSINRVNASGRGEVRMALVKDDIGNWSLKSFDNNPEDLLQAYRDTTVAGLQALAKVAKKGALPADGLIGFAASLSAGGLGGQDQGVSVHAGVASVRSDLTIALSEIEARYSTEIAKISVEEEQAATAVTEAETSLASSNRVIATQEALLASLDVRLDEAARSNAPAERIEELAQEKAQARASLSTAQLERASSEREVIEAKAHSAHVAERRKREGQRAIEMAQLELRAYQRALVAIQKMGGPAQTSSPDPPANPLPSMAIR